MTKLIDAEVVPIRALSDEEALAWLGSNTPVTASNTELARLWGWNDMKVSRRLKAWAGTGKIARSLTGLTVATPSVMRAVMPSLAVAVSPPVGVEGVAAGDQPRPDGRIHEGPRGSWGHRVVAYATAVALAAAAAYFSIGGLVELFPAQTIPVAVLGALLEVTKLVMAGWLAANWRVAGGLLRAVMVLLVVGLVTVNAGGTFARLIESHLAVTSAASTSVGERTAIVDAKIAEQARRVTGIEAQEREIAEAVSKMTSSGKAKAAIAATEAQSKRRDAIAKARQEAADRLVELQGDRARLEAESRLVAAQTGPARYLAVQFGTDAETVIRWLVALLVMLVDPSAVVLTIAAAQRRPTVRVTP
jgi:hypothetical protein